MTDAVKRLRSALWKLPNFRWYGEPIIRAAAAVCDHFAQHHDFYEGGYEVGNKCRDAILSALDPKGGDDD